MTHANVNVSLTANVLFRAAAPVYNASLYKEAALT